MCYHVLSLCIVLRNRKSANLSTYLAFVDFKKAFDSVDRFLLLYKLKEIGIVGKMYNAIAAMYKCPRARVFLSSDHSTDWFDCPSGVKQGDNVSPTLFSIFINDLVKGINELGLGVKIDNRVEVDGTIIDNSIILSCLLYADDLVFLSETEENLQKNA